MNKKIIFIILSTLLTSCYTSKHLESEDYILQQNSIIINNKKINRINNVSNKEINAIIKQKPNKKIIGLIPFHLWLYNISNPNKINWINNYLRRIGEKPIILNEELIKRSVSQIKTHFDNNGYFTSLVDTDIIYKQKKAFVSYNITTGDSYTINNIKYSKTENTDINNLINRSIEKAAIKKGDIFTYNSLNNERIRIEKLLQNNGYYKFSKEVIYIKADSTPNKLININILINERSDSIQHGKFYLDKVFIHIDKNSSTKDTMLHNGYAFIKSKDSDFNIKPNTISDMLMIEGGNIYSKIDTDKTYRNLSDLMFFKKIEIEFVEQVEKNKLNCNIYLESPTKMYYSIETEAKISKDEDIGISSYVQFGNNNLFQGAENLNSKIKISLGNRQTVSGNDDNIFNTKEISYQLSLKKPKLILPKQLNNLTRNSFQMNTNFVFSITQRQRPDFSIQTITQKLAYNWKNSNETQHQLNLIEITFSDIEENDFIADLINDNIYLQEQFENKFIPSTNYTFTFNNQKIYKISHYTYLKTKFETTGNFFQLLGRSTGFNKNENDDYIVFKNPFSQYARIDLDLRRYFMFTKDNTLAFRGFFGIGYAYGNSEKLPIQKQFFSGGVNSIRAWEAFNLGPGSSANAIENNYSTGDLKLEFNIEYRFAFINSLKSALFIDGGNIWLTKDNTQNGSTFKFDNFIDEIALGVGFGFRYDFDFFVLRLDIASKLKDPSRDRESRWIKNPLNEKFQYNLAIGYPF